MTQERMFFSLYGRRNQEDQIKAAGKPLCAAEKNIRRSQS
jgi:hypothetical protein